MFSKNVILNVGKKGAFLFIAAILYTMCFLMPLRSSEVANRFTDQTIILFCVAILAILSNKTYGVYRRDFVPWIILLALQLFSCLIHGGDYITETLIVAICFLCCYMICFKDWQIRMLIWASVLAPLFYYGSQMIGRWNSVAVILAATMLGAVNLVQLYVKKNLLRQILIIAATVVALINIIDNTGSRGSTVVCVVLCAVNILTRTDGEEIKIKTVTVVVLLLLAVTFSIYNPNINKFLFHKYSASITSGRNDILIEVFRNITLFGQGRSYASNLSLSWMVVDAHNSFADFLAIYGVVPSIVALYIVINNLRRIILLKRRDAFIPCMNFAIFWLLISFAENANPYTSRAPEVTFLFMIWTSLISNAERVESGKQIIGGKNHESC